MSEIDSGSHDSMDTGGGSEISSGGPSIGGETSHGSGEVTSGNGEMTHGSGEVTSGNGEMTHGGGEVSAGNGGISPGGPEISSAAGEMAPAGGDSLEIGESASGWESSGLSREISVNPGETTPGRSQILETPASLEWNRDQKAVEAYHRQSIDQILEANGKYMTAADRERVAAGADRVALVAHNPARDRTGGYRSGRIEVSRISPLQMERSTKHETNHFASKHREILVPEPDKHGYTVYKTVGTRQSSWFHSTRTGQESGYQERGRGMNEGLTTLFTNQQLTELSKEKGEAAERAQIYSRTVELCEQLESLVGKDSLREAYYGGNQQKLEAQVNALAGEKEYGRLRDCMDRTLSRDPAKSVAAMREAQEILARMSERSKMA